MLKIFTKEKRSLSCDDESDVAAAAAAHAAANAPSGSARYRSRLGVLLAGCVLAGGLRLALDDGARSRPRAAAVAASSSRSDVVTCALPRPPRPFAPLPGSAPRPAVARDLVVSVATVPARRDALPIMLQSLSRGATLPRSVYVVHGGRRGQKRGRGLNGPSIRVFSDHMLEGKHPNFETPKSEMITRPKTSRNERRVTEGGASKGEKKSPVSGPGGRAPECPGGTRGTGRRKGDLLVHFVHAADDRGPIEKYVGALAAIEALEDVAPEYLLVLDDDKEYDARVVEAYALALRGAPRETAFTVQSPPAQLRAAPGRNRSASLPRADSETVPEDGPRRAPFPSFGLSARGVESDRGGGEGEISARSPMLSDPGFPAAFPVAFGSRGVGFRLAATEGLAAFAAAAASAEPTCRVVDDIVVSAFFNDRAIAVADVPGFSFKHRPWLHNREVKEVSKTSRLRSSNRTSDNARCHDALLLGHRRRRTR